MFPIIDLASIRQISPNASACDTDARTDNAIPTPQATHEDGDENRQQDFSDSNSQADLHHRLGGPGGLGGPGALPSKPLPCWAMTSRAYNVLEGMGEAMLGLARKHSTPQQWAAWLKVRHACAVTDTPPPHLTSSRILFVCGVDAGQSRFARESILST